MNQFSGSEKFQGLIEKLIHASIDHPDFGVSALANQMNMHRTTLLRNCERHYHLNPVNLIQLRRMELADRILAENPKLKQKDIYLRVGYADPTSFSKVYCRYKAWKRGERRNWG